jgi:hypothetical protein
MSDIDKRYATLAAQFALCGFSLIRTQPGAGTAPYVVGRWGWLKPIHDLDEARNFLEQIQGTKND